MYVCRVSERVICKLHMLTLSFPFPSFKHQQQEMSDSVKFWDQHRSTKSTLSAAAALLQEGQEMEVDSLTLCVPIPEPGKLRSDGAGKIGKYASRQAGVYHGSYILTADM